MVLEPLSRLPLRFRELHVRLFVVEELLREWNWKEHFSGQPENERYLNYVADKFDLRRDIQLNARVTSAVFDEKENRWELGLASGHWVRPQ